MDPVKEAVLGLLDAYEGKLVLVQLLVSAACQSISEAGPGVAVLSESMNDTLASLRETLARKRYLRRADFDRMVGPVLSSLDTERLALETERGRIEESLTDFLDDEHSRLGVVRSKIEGASSGNVPRELQALKDEMTAEAALAIGSVMTLQSCADSYREVLSRVNQTLQSLLRKEDLLEPDDLKGLVDVAGSANDYAPREESYI